MVPLHAPTRKGALHEAQGRAGCPQPAGRRRGEDTAPYPAARFMAMMHFRILEMQAFHEPSHSSSTRCWRFRGRGGRFDSCSGCMCEGEWKLPRNPVAADVSPLTCLWGSLSRLTSAATSANWFMVPLHAPRLKGAL